jgi:pyruvate dehydrogenase E1 component alpha subunit
MRMYEQMLTIRLFEEKVNELYTSARMPGLAHLYSGQEAVAVGVCAALRRDDYITSTHRGHGHCLAKGARVDRMFAELLGKEAGYCRGKGGSMHIADQDTGNLGANACACAEGDRAAGACRDRGRSPVRSRCTVPRPERGGSACLRLASLHSGPATGPAGPAAAQRSGPAPP